MRPCGRLGGLILAVSLGLLAGSQLFVTAAVGQEEEPAIRLGSETCLECHQQYASAWGRERHNTYHQGDQLPEELEGCEGCHGPGSKHLEDPEFKSIINPVKNEGRAAAEPCLACHGTHIAAADWMGSSHAKAGVSCGGCHEVHAATDEPMMLRKSQTETCLSCHMDQKAGFQLNSHHPVLEGRMDCIDCHDPHRAGEGAKKLLKSGDDRCLSCHMEKRGPFVFEHSTALDSADASCQECHAPHGSPNPKLARFFGRALCLQCHTDIAADAAHQTRTGNCWTAGCHNRLHGSNNNRLFIN